MLQGLRARILQSLALSLGNLASFIIKPPKEHSYSMRRLSKIVIYYVVLRASHTHTLDFLKEICFDNGKKKSHTKIVVFFGRGYSAKFRANAVCKTK